MRQARHMGQIIDASENVNGTVPGAIPALRSLARSLYLGDPLTSDQKELLTGILCQR